MNIEETRRLVWESVQAAMAACPLCNGTIRLEDVDIHDTTYGCDTGCDAAYLGITHDCGYDAESVSLGTWTQWNQTPDEVKTQAEDCLERLTTYR